MEIKILINLGYENENLRIFGIPSAIYLMFFDFDLRANPSSAAAADNGPTTAPAAALRHPTPHPAVRAV